MPQIPTRRDLGRIQISGADRPVEINPMVAYDIGRAGQAWDRAFGEISSAFGKLANDKQKVEDDTWLAERKIETLKAENDERNRIELEAGEDGTGYEQINPSMKGIAEAQERVPGGSEKAREQYKLFAAERTYEAGKWGVNSAQARAKQFNLNRLDRRLDELTNMTAQNPHMSAEYFKAYTEEVQAQVGNTIDAPTAATRVERARQNILKVGVIEKAKKNPTDYARAMKALEGAGVVPKDQSRLPQASGLTAAQISTRLETGETDPLKGVANISRDSANSRSYGNFGLNSRGANSSAQQFANEYGEQFGLSAKPGTEEFNKQWKAAASADPEGLHAAELKFYNENLVSDVSGKLTKAGVPRNIAEDPRVTAYFADRMVQQGSGSIGKHAKRIAGAVGNANGDAAQFLRNMSDADRAALKQDFPTALATGVYSEKGHNNRLMGRESMALYGIGGGQAPSQALASSVRVRDLPAVAGTIQPSELMSLKPDDFFAVTSQLKPYLATEMEERVKNAAAALAASGSQSVISDEDIELMPTIAGPKTAEKWRALLDESLDFHNIYQSSKQMTTAERRAHIAAIRPDEDAGMASEDERKHYQNWVKVNDELTKAMRANPVEYFASVHESGKAAMRDIAGAPPGPEGLATRERAYETLLRLQSQEGLDQKDITLLAKDQAEGVVNRIMSAKTSAEAIGTVDELRGQYGKHFNTVWGQLARNGAPTSFLAMPTATMKGQNALIDVLTLERNLSEAGGKDTDRKGALRTRAGISEKDLAAAVNGEISDLVGAIDPSSFGLNESYRQAVEKVTLYNMIANGMSVKEAAATAGRNVFRESLSIYNRVMIPNSAYGGPLDRSALRQGINRVPKELTKLYDQIVVPLTPDPTTTKAYDRSRYINRLQADNRLVTANNMKGVYLLDHENQRVMIESDIGPIPFFMSWEQLRSAGNAVSGRTGLGIYN